MAAKAWLALRLLRLHPPNHALHELSLFSVPNPANPPRPTRPAAFPLMAAPLRVPEAELLEAELWRDVLAVLPNPTTAQRAGGGSTSCGGMPVQHFRISLLPMMRMESQDERPPTSLKPTSLKPKSLKRTSPKRDEASRDEASLLLNPWKHLPHNASSKSWHNCTTLAITSLEFARQHS